MAKNITVKVRENQFMPLEKGGHAEGGETVTVSAEYYPKVRYFCEEPDNPPDEDEGKDDSASASKSTKAKK